MAAGSSVTWTHYSVRYEVTCGKKARVRVDGPLHPHGRGHLLALALPLYPLARPARTGCCVCVDAARPHGCGADAQKNKKIKK
jgi:hypothetical protein